MHSHYNPGGFPRICAAPAFPPAPKRGTELDSGYSGKRSIASEYHLNGVWVFPINQTGGRASGPLGRALHRAGRKHGSDFARVIFRWRELKSIPDTEKLMIYRYQKMISRGIIPDILISANAVPRVNIYLSNSPISQIVFPPGVFPSDGQLKYRKLAHDKQSTDGCIAIFHKYCCYTKRVI